LLRGRGKSALASRPYDFCLNWKLDSSRPIRMRLPRHVKHPPWSREYARRVRYAYGLLLIATSSSKRPIRTKWLFHIDEFSIYSDLWTAMHFSLAAARRFWKERVKYRVYFKFFVVLESHGIRIEKVFIPKLNRISHMWHLKLRYLRPTLSSPIPNHASAYIFRIKLHRG
jgi:hypothetical protein